MLEELRVRDLALIEDIRLEFGPGMTVLTGETGAGKTALVGALKLLVGERADSTLVRAGASEALVEGRIRDGDAEVVAKRRVSLDGRSRAWLDGEMATVGALAARLGPFVDLHGQHEHQSLLIPGRHVSYLDGYIGAEAVEHLDAYRRARSAWAEAVAALAAREASLAEAEDRADYLRFVVSDIDSCAPLPDEDDELERRLPAMQHAERLAHSANEAYAALRGEGAASDCAARAAGALARVAGVDPELDTLAARLDEALRAVEDIGLELREYGESVEFDPSALDAAHSRLSVLATLKKKYGPALGDVLATRADARAALDELDAGGAGTVVARDLCLRAETEMRAAAEALGQLRARAVPQFLSHLHEAVADLAMNAARFDVYISMAPVEEWTEDGPQRVEFMFAPGPDQPFKSLARIASGGELSRVMLALKGVLGRADRVPVLVFDEVDAGIGGATALAVGRRLRELSSRHQVLVVTHLAQVAVYADVQVVVSKSLVGDKTATTATVVRGDARVAEVARMIAGADTEAGLAHARELIASVSGEGQPGVIRESIW